MEDRTEPIWDGDKGTLPLKARAAIGRLMSDYAVDDAARFDGERMLDIIGEYRDDIERVLADSLLVLVKNDRYHVAWAEPASIEGRHEIRCAKAARHVSGVTAYAMCACKEAALEAEANGVETCTIDAGWLMGRLSEMRSLRAGNDEKSLEAAARHALDAMHDMHLIRPRRGSDEWEVRPLLSAIVDESWLRSLAETEAAASDEAGERVSDGGVDGDDADLGPCGPSQALEDGGKDE